MHMVISFNCEREKHTNKIVEERRNLRLGHTIINAHVLKAQDFVNYYYIYTYAFKHLILANGLFTNYWCMLVGPNGVA